jgi:uncharacterized integral membrane protein
MSTMWMWNIVGILLIILLIVVIVRMNDGKFYFKLTKTTYDQCCCDMK